MNGILAGLRIVEGSAFIAAPMGGMTLAQLGADVIRFDDLKGGLDSDRWPVTKDGQSIYWAGLNKGKRSIAVDLRSPRGREILTALITAPGEAAGIFSTNLPARGWIAYEELTKKRADLIALNIVGARDGSARCPGGPRRLATNVPDQSAWKVLLLTPQSGHPQSSGTSSQRVRRCPPSGASTITKSGTKGSKNHLAAESPGWSANSF